MLKDTSCRDCSRRVAVTMISSMAPLSALLSGSSPASCAVAAPDASRAMQTARLPLDPVRTFMSCPPPDGADRRRRGRASESVWKRGR